LEYQRGHERIQRKKTGLADLTRLIREDAIDLSTLLYTVVNTKKNTFTRFGMFCVYNSLK